MPFAPAISLTLTRYLCATLPNVSPDPTVWTGGVGSRVWAELPTTEVGMAACAGAAGSEADAGVRGAAAWATFAPPPAAPVKSGDDRGGGGPYARTACGGGN